MTEERISKFLDHVAETTYNQLKPKFETQIHELYRSGKSRDDIYREVQNSLEEFIKDDEGRANKFFDTLFKEQTDFKYIKDVDDYNGYLFDILTEKLQILIVEVDRDRNSVYKRFYG